jgi:hypothetical protein
MHPTREMGWSISVKFYQFYCGTAPAGDHGVMKRIPKETYELDDPKADTFTLTRSSLLMNYVFMAVFAIVAMILVVRVVLDPAEETTARIFAALWALFVFLVVIPHSLKTPHTIVLKDSGQLTFVSVVSKRSYKAQDLKAIKASFGQRYFLYFKFKKRKVSVINSIDNFTQLKWRLKGYNQDLETKKC